MEEDTPIVDVQEKRQDDVLPSDKPTKEAETTYKEPLKEAEATSKDQPPTEESQDQQPPREEQKIDTMEEEAGPSAEDWRKGLFQL